MRLLARDDDFLEGVVRLDLLFHLRLDLREILRRDAVRQFHVVIKSVFDRRAGGELGVGPEPQDGGGHDVGGGMPDAFQLGHLLAVVQCLAFFRFLLFSGHGKRLTTKTQKDEEKNELPV